MQTVRGSRCATSGLCGRFRGLGSRFSRRVFWRWSIAGLQFLRDQAFRQCDIPDSFAGIVLRHLHELGQFSLIVSNGKDEIDNQILIPNHLLDYWRDFRVLVNHIGGRLDHLIQIRIPSAGVFQFLIEKFAVGLLLRCCGLCGFALLQLPVE